MLKGDGIVLNWLGHPSFEMGTLSLSVRRMPAFFETFPVILIDQGGTLRAEQEKLNLVKYLHLIRRQLLQMVFLEPLQEVGIHFHM